MILRGITQFKGAILTIIHKHQMLFIDINIQKMKKFFLSIFLFSVSLLTGCTEGGDLEGLAGNTFTVSSALEASKISPNPPSDATKGTITGWYDEESNILAFTLKYTKDISVTKKDQILSVHFYKVKTEVGTAAPDRSFPVTINVDGTDPSKPVNVTGSLSLGLSGSKAFSSQEKTSFMAGNWYVVLLTDKFPKGIAAGEITLTRN